jgi:hypothetical protein
MKTTRQLYCQFLLSSQTNFTCTYLADHYEGLDENSVYRYLQGETLSPSLVWEKAKENIVLSERGYIIFDDTVLDKNFSFRIEGVRQQYSGNAHAVVKGIGVVNCVYYNPDTDRYTLLDYRIFDPDRDGKDKNDHVREMLERLDERKIPYTTVLMDSWYATVKLMMTLEHKGKRYYCPIRKNRLIDDSGRHQPYHRVGELDWTLDELRFGKTVKIRGFPATVFHQLFRIPFSSERTEYIVTNDHSHPAADDIRKEVAIRWKIEQLHRELKQCTGIEANQCRINRSQRNHIACAMQVWLLLSSLAHEANTTIYALKQGLLDRYMIQQLRHPTIRFT